MNCCSPDTPARAKAHVDHDPMPYNGYNSNLAHLCQICGQATTLDLSTSPTAGDHS